MSDDGADSTSSSSSSSSSFVFVSPEPEPAREFRWDVDIAQLDREDRVHHALVWRLLDCPRGVISVKQKGLLCEIVIGDGGYERSRFIFEFQPPCATCSEEMWRTVSARRTSTGDPLPVRTDLLSLQDLTIQVARHG